MLVPCMVIIFSVVRVGFTGVRKGSSSCFVFESLVRDKVIGISKSS